MWSVGRADGQGYIQPSGFGFVFSTARIVPRLNSPECLRNSDSNIWWPQIVPRTKLSASMQLGSHSEPSKVCWSSTTSTWMFAGKWLSSFVKQTAAALGGEFACPVAVDMFWDRLFVALYKSVAGNSHCITKLALLLVMDFFVSPSRMST